MSNTPNCGPTARRATGEPDPIFAVIERHRAALRGWLDAYDRLGVLHEMIPEAQRRWEIFYERPDDCTDGAGMDRGECSIPRGHQGIG
jgi:hypothetical protein